MTISTTAPFLNLLRGKPIELVADGLPSLLAAAYLLYVIFGLGGESEVPAGNQSVSIAETAQTAVEAPNYLEIGDWHLFGLPPVGHDDQAAVVESRSQLKLQGTFVAWPNIRSAVIQAEDGSQKKYRIGDQLPDGAQLREILPDRVLLSHNGRRESLALAKLSASPLPAE